jgi:hypothetical protein
MTVNVNDKIKDGKKERFSNKKLPHGNKMDNMRVAISMQLLYF